VAVPPQPWPRVGGGNPRLRTKHSPPPGPRCPRPPSLKAGAVRVRPIRGPMGPSRQGPFPHNPAGAGGRGSPPFLRPVRITGARGVFAPRGSAVADQRRFPRRGPKRPSREGGARWIGRGAPPYEASPDGKQSRWPAPEGSRGMFPPRVSPEGPGGQRGPPLGTAPGGPPAPGPPRVSGRGPWGGPPGARPAGERWKGSQGRWGAHACRASGGEPTPAAFDRVPSFCPFPAPGTGPILGLKPGRSPSGCPKGPEARRPGSRAPVPPPFGVLESDPVSRVGPNRLDRGDSFSRARPTPPGAHGAPAALDRPSHNRGTIRGWDPGPPVRCSPRRGFWKREIRRAGKLHGPRVSGDPATGEASVDEGRPIHSRGSVPRGLGPFLGPVVDQPWDSGWRSLRGNPATRGPPPGTGRGPQGFHPLGNPPMGPAGGSGLGDGPRPRRAILGAAPRVPSGSGGRRFRRPGGDETTLVGARGPRGRPPGLEPSRGAWIRGPPRESSPSFPGLDSAGRRPRAGVGPVPTDLQTWPEKKVPPLGPGGRTRGVRSSAPRCGFARTSTIRQGGFRNLPRRRPLPVAAGQMAGEGGGEKPLRRRGRLGGGGGTGNGGKKWIGPGRDSPRSLEENARPSLLADAGPWAPTDRKRGWKGRWGRRNASAGLRRGEAGSRPGRAPPPQVPLGPYSWPGPKLPRRAGPGSVSIASEPPRQQATPASAAAGPASSLKGRQVETPDPRAVGQRPPWP